MNLDRLQEIAESLCARQGWSKPKYIDNGASAAVYETTTNDGKAALKIYDPSFFEGDNALIEANRISLQTSLRSHGCKTLIDVLDAAELTEDGTWYLLMEFCPWDSLEKLLTKVPDDAVHPLLKQLVHAVQFLANAGFVHRDIKPANIVVSPDFKNLKLLDFGVMRKVDFDEGSGTDGFKFIATAQYSPPEYLTRDEVEGKEGFDAIDIYQVGAVLHDMITKTALFAEEKATRNKFILYRAVTTRAPRIVSAGVEPRLIALCLAALDKDPAKRLMSVSLNDFLVDADDLDALRRRVANGPTGQLPPKQNLLIAAWEQKVRSWGREAAQLEADTLGAVTMKKQQIRGGLRWQLEFENADAAIYLDLKKGDGQLEVHILSSADQLVGTPILVIDPTGPNMPETGIPGALSATYLFALDAAISASHTNQ